MLQYIRLFPCFFTVRIGFETARRLALDGAKVMICSRKQKKVDAAVKKLTDEHLTVAGVTCHVGQADDRTNLFREVRAYLHIYYTCVK